jgi:general secretion pathway protein H
MARIRRTAERALTLVEVLVVCALIAVLTVAVVAGTNQLPGARLKRSSTMIASATKVAYSRATATSRYLRIVLDFEQNAIWLEEADAPMLVQSKDLTGAGGADPATAAEKAALAESDRIVKGPPIPKPTFRPVEALGFGEQEGTIKGAKKLQRGITIREVQTGHDENPVTKGRAYLYFWPGGLTERASIQLRIGDKTEDSSTMTLIVSPLTGKVTIKGGPVALKPLAGDQSDSEREDTGF